MSKVRSFSLDGYERLCSLFDVDTVGLTDNEEISRVCRAVYTLAYYDNRVPRDENDQNDNYLLE